MSGTGLESGPGQPAAGAAGTGLGSPGSGAPAAEVMFRRILRNAATLLGGKLAMGLINLAATGIALRALGVETFGTLILIHTFAQAAAAFTKFQSWQAVLRYGAVSLENGRQADFRALVRFTAWLDAGAGGIGILLCSAVLLLFGGAFDIAPGIAATAALYATSTAFMVMATPTGLLRLFNRFDVLATRDTLGALFRLAGALIASVAGLGLHGFLTVWYLATAIGGLSLAYAAWREMRRRGLAGAGATGPLPSAIRAHPGLWSFVWSTNLTTTLSLASGHLGTLCVGAMLGPAEAALFALARQIGEAALKPGRFLSPAIYPEIARLAALRDVAAIRVLLRRVLVVSSAGSAGLLALLALLGHPLLRLVGGAQAVPAYPVMLLLACASAIGFAGFALEPMLISVGRQAAALRARLVAAILYMPAALFGLHAIGLPGAGMASIATAMVMLAAQAGPASKALRAGNGCPSPHTR
jgi:O-antigen/teichoic acid export membrane protein